MWESPIWHFQGSNLPKRLGIGGPGEPLKQGLPRRAHVCGNRVRRNYSLVLKSGEGACGNLQNKNSSPQGGIESPFLHFHNPKLQNSDSLGGASRRDHHFDTFTAQTLQNNSKSPTCRGTGCARIKVLPGPACAPLTSWKAERRGPHSC